MAVIQDAYTNKATLHPQIRILQNPEPSYLSIPHDSDYEGLCQLTNNPVLPPQPPATLELVNLPEPNPGTMKATARIMQHTWTLNHTAAPFVKVHVDGGANRSITNDRDQLLNYKNIKKYPMSGVAAGEPALVCTGMGYLPWQADDAKVVLVKCYYSPTAIETIVSPTDIVVNNYSNFTAWRQYSNIDTKQG
jgi:hypothetical protein